MKFTDTGTSWADNQREGSDKPLGPAYRFRLFPPQFPNGRAVTSGGQKRNVCWTLSSGTFDRSPEGFPLLDPSPPLCVGVT